MDEILELIKKWHNDSFTIQDMQYRIESLQKTIDNRDKQISKLQAIVDTQNVIIKELKAKLTDAKVKDKNILA